MNPLRFFWGLIVILLGLILIATNAGWISTGVWWSVLMLWPVILIVVGLKLLLHDNDRLFMWLVLVIVLLSAAYVVAANQNKWDVSFTKQSNVNIGTEVFNENFTDKYDANMIKKLDLEVSTGAAEVTIQPLPQGSANSELYQIKTQNMGKLSIDRNASGDTINLIVNEQGFGFHINPGSNLERKITIFLPEHLLLDLNISSGASKINADFSSLKTENVKLSIGASSGEVVLSEKVARQKLELSAGASSLTFKAPQNLGIKATFEGGLNNVNIDSDLGFTKSDDTYTTRDFEKAANQLVLTSSSGVSNIRFQLK